MTPIKVLLPLTAGLLLLASCGGGKVPSTQYYQLNLPPAPAAQGAQTDFSIVVLPFRASEILTRDRVVYRPTPQEVGYYEYHLWAEDPASTVERAMIQAIEAQRTFSTVAGFDGRTKADFVLRGRLEQLEEIDYESGVNVKVTLSAELLDGQTQRVLWRGTASESQSVDRSEVADVVAKLSNATSAAVKKLAADVDGYIRSR